MGKNIHFNCGEARHFLRECLYPKKSRVNIAIKLGEVQIEIYNSILNSKLLITQAILVESHLRHLLALQGKLKGNFVKFLINMGALDNFMAANII